LLGPSPGNFGPFTNFSSKLQTFFEWLQIFGFLTRYDFFVLFDRLWMESEKKYFEILFILVLI
jgi:hypothetical protein